MRETVKREHGKCTFPTHTIEEILKPLKWNHKQIKIPFDCVSLAHVNCGALSQCFHMFSGWDHMADECANIISDPRHMNESASHQCLIYVKDSSNWKTYDFALVEEQHMISLTNLIEACKKKLVTKLEYPTHLLFYCWLGSIYSLLSKSIKNSN